MTRAITPTVTLPEALRIVTAELAVAEAAAGSCADDPLGFHARRREEMERLAARLEEKVAARITDRWDGARVRICGIASTSTTGISGALHNWIAAATKREAQS